MTPEQIHRVKETWRLAAPRADAVAQLFYQRLFNIDETLKGLFSECDMAAQRQKLVMALGFAVDNLDKPGLLVPVVEDLGRRHVGYGATEAHYDSVGAALLWTLERGLGEAWTKEAAEAWTAAYGLLSGAMKSAARALAKAPEHKPELGLGSAGYAA